MTWMRTMLGAAAIAAVALLVAATPAQAAHGREFGGHIASCAQTMGFDGEHNPGMHNGHSGWAGHTCP